MLGTFPLWIWKYFPHKPCEACKGSGKEIKWIDLSDFARLLDKINNETQARRAALRPRTSKNHQKAPKKPQEAWSRLNVEHDYTKRRNLISVEKLNRKSCSPNHQTRKALKELLNYSSDYFFRYYFVLHDATTDNIICGLYLATINTLCSTLTREVVPI